jgi:hypothetical protein
MYFKSLRSFCNRPVICQCRLCLKCRNFRLVPFADFCSLSGHFHGPFWQKISQLTACSISRRHLSTCISKEMEGEPLLDFAGTDDFITGALHRFADFMVVSCGFLLLKSGIYPYHILVKGNIFRRYDLIQGWMVITRNTENCTRYTSQTPDRRDILSGSTFFQKSLFSDFF